MKRPTYTIATLLLLATGVVASADAFAGSAATADPASPSTAFARPAITTDRAGHRHDFGRFLERYEAANSAFLNGDPAPWLSIVTENDPASIFGGFGGLGNVGVADVRSTLSAGRGRVPPERGRGRRRVPGQGRAGQDRIHGRDRTRRGPVRGPHRVTTARPASHDDVPLREGRLEDHPPARGLDDRSATSNALMVRRSQARWVLGHPSWSHASRDPLQQSRVRRGRSCPKD